VQSKLWSCRGRSLPVAFAPLWVLALILAVPAFAQDQYDCASFGSQESAQAELERDPSDPNNLDADNDGQACEDYTYGTSRESPQGGDPSGDLDCADFATQEEAQAELEKDPSDPNRLDADDDGKACEELPSADGGATGRGTADAGVARCDTFLRVVRDDNGSVRQQYQGNELIMHRIEQCLSKDVLPNTIVHRKLPGTGGPPLLVLGLAAVALGVVAGIVVLRRS
jgi:hypothetical protein